MILTPDAVASLSDLFRHCPVASQDSYRQSANFLTNEQQKALRRRLPNAYRDESIIAHIPAHRPDLKGDNVALEKMSMGITEMQGTFIVTSHRFIFLEGERRASFYCTIPFSDLKTIEKPTQNRSKLQLRFKTRRVPYNLQFVVTHGDIYTKTKFREAVQELFTTLTQHK